MESREHLQALTLPPGAPSQAYFFRWAEYANPSGFSGSAAEFAPFFQRHSEAPTRVLLAFQRTRCACCEIVRLRCKRPSFQASRAERGLQNSAVNPPCFGRFLSCQRTFTALDFMHEVNPKRSGTTMTKRFVKSGSPPVWEENEADSGAKREANRKRIAAGKTSKSRPVSRNPQIADSKSDRWNARRRTMKAASEGRGVTRYE